MTHIKILAALMCLFSATACATTETRVEPLPNSETSQLVSVYLVTLEHLTIGDAINVQSQIASSLGVDIEQPNGGANHYKFNVVGVTNTMKILDTALQTLTQAGYSNSQLKVSILPENKILIDRIY